MTTMPPPRPHWAPAAIANAVGLLLLIVGAVGLLTAAWQASPTLGLAATAVYTIFAGYLLATTEFKEG